MEQFEEKILRIVRKHMQDPTASITPDTKIEDIGIDSYGLIEVVFDLEEELKIDIPYNANDGSLREMTTVGELLDELMALIARSASSVR